jgi:hypothetical protein
VGYFFIGKQKVVLFPKYRENSWEFAASALRPFLVNSSNFFQILAKQSTFVILSITFNKLHTPNSSSIYLFQLNINFLYWF